jgi:hypothetical protein
MDADDQAKLDELWTQMRALCARIDATPVGPEQEELRGTLGALCRVRALLWNDMHPEGEDQRDPRPKFQTDALPADG